MAGTSVPQAPFDLLKNLLAEIPCGIRKAALVILPRGVIIPHRSSAVSAALMNSFGTLNVENIPGSP